MNINILIIYIIICLIIILYRIIGYYPITFNTNSIYHNIYYDNIYNSLKTGDLLLYSGYDYDYRNRMFGHKFYSHTSMILKENNELSL